VPKHGVKISVLAVNPRRAKEASSAKFSDDCQREGRRRPFCSSLLGTKIHRFACFSVSFPVVLASCTPDLAGA
jgi:hypothetical protein